MKNLPIFPKTVPANKKEQENIASLLVRSVEDGDLDPIEAVVKAKSMQEVLKGFLDSPAVKENVIKECEKYGKGERPGYKTAEVQVKETGTKWDFTGCNDHVWNELSARMESLKEQLKEREAYLKTIKERKAEIDETTGEVYDIFPPVRSAGISFAITFKKS